MSRKKIVFFIVEGPSEDAALSAALERIFVSNEVTVKVTYGDVTTEIFTTPQNVQNKIVELIKDEAGKIFKPKDFAEIIHLVDMDGAFIDKHLVRFADTENVFYGSDYIECKKPDREKETLKKKSEILNKLINLPKVWRDIPYSVYFFSANFDHVLHNDSNLLPEDKVEKADEFAKEYGDDPTRFIQFFSDNSFSLDMSYGESWDFIKLDNNSLKRFSNFNLLFTDKAKNESLLSVDTSD